MSEVKKLTEMSATEKHAIVIDALSKEGYNPSQAANLIGVSRQYVHTLNKKVKDSGGALMPLVASAKKSIKLLVNGKPVGGMADVKGSDVLAAAKMIMDRAEPILQRVQSTSYKFVEEITHEDREKYQKMLGLPVVDAEFDTIEPKQIEHREENK